jgi:Na+/melibiose symporter-like transporter
VLCILHRLLWIVPAALPIVLPHRRDLYAPIVIAAFALSDVLANVSTSAWLSWMADLLPGERSGWFWGVRARVLSAGLVIVSAIFGWLLDQQRGEGSLDGFIVVFALAAVFGTADIVVHCFVHEPCPHPHPHKKSVTRQLASALPRRELARFTWAFGAYSCATAMPGIANGLPGFFNIVYLHEACGASYTQASLILIAAAIGGVLWAPWIGRQIDRRGAQKMAVALMATGSLATLAWFAVGPGHFAIGGFHLPKAVLLMSAASLVIGGAYSGVLICQLRISQQYTPIAGRTLAMAVHWSAVGLISSAGPIAAGWCKDRWPLARAIEWLPVSMKLSYFHLIIAAQFALIWLIAIPIIAATRPPKKDALVI